MKQKSMTLKEVFQRAVKLHLDGNLDEAAGLYRICLAKAPDDADTWSKYGSLLRRQMKLTASLAAHRRAMELDPAQLAVRANHANTLWDIGAFEDALEEYRHLVADYPDNIELFRSLAAVMRCCWLNAEAIALVNDTEERLGPDAQLQIQRALAHLMLGNYRQGFADYEARFGTREASLPSNTPWPQWQGEDLKGKRIVILPEQGLGDTIVIARFLPRLKALGAEVCLMVRKPLLRLFEQLAGVDELRTALKKADVFDYYTLAMSLPHLAGFADEGVPPAPRLAIPDDSRHRAQRITAPFRTRFRIGIVWTGAPSYRNNHRRSTRLENFLCLARVPGVQLFSLYKGEDYESFVSSGLAGVILDACGNDRDLADTAAVIDEMDLMITTDTAVVHVAASLGKPVWNLLPYEGYWLYGAGETTPWYPSMRLFRQRASGDWDEVFERVELALRALLTEKTA